MTAKAWRRVGDGIWSVDANWSPGTAATSADDVTLSGPSGTSVQTITGPGASASLLVLGNTVLKGAFTTGVLRVGNASAPGSLALAAAGTLSATTLSIVDGPLSLGGAGTRVAVSGAATLGGTPGTGTNAAIVSLTTGAKLQVAVLSLLAADSPDRITIDATSSLEVGTAGTAAAGSLTVDPGQVLAGAGSIAAGIENDGTIIAQSGTLSLATTGPLLGAGYYEIAAGATLSLGAAATGAVVFTGQGGTLGLATAFGRIGTVVAAPGAISGFGPSDTIAINSVNLPVSTATWSGATGLLTVMSGTAPLGSLVLAGDFTGFTFQVTPSGLSSATSNIALVPVAAGGASPGTAAADAYTWRTPVSGAWNLAANWTDTTVGPASAGVAPGANDAVTLQGPVGSTYQVITGVGVASSLVALGRSSLAGSVAAGQVTIGSVTTAGALNVAAGASLTTSALDVLDGPLQVTGPGGSLMVGTALTIGGTLASPFTIASDTLTVGTGAVVTAGSLILLPGRSFNAVSVDGASKLEIGTGGRAAAGTITIDPGRTLAGTGSVSGTIVNDGTILAQGGTLSLSITQTLGGAGTLQVDAGATLSLSGPTTEPVLFRSTSGTLSLTSYYGLGGYVAAPAGLIAGFRQGDAIAVSSFGTALTAVRWQQASATQGTLTLLAGTAVLGVLALAGNYAGASWAVASTGGFSATVTMATPARASNAVFDADYYLLHNLDVAFSGVDPLQHYETQGWKEGRDAAAGFDTLDYLAANPDVKAAGIDPLEHYTQYGRAEGRAAFAVPGSPADALVDAAYYYAHDRDVAAAGVDASAHYLAGGWTEGRNPDAWFDTSYYLAQNPDVRAAGIDPLQHYEQFGWMEGRAPSLLFDGAKYLAANPDVAAAGFDPLQHYLTEGQAEGRAAPLVGGLAAADPLVDAAYYDRQLGATLMPVGAAAQQQAAWLYDNGGWQGGLNPDAWFDTAYYLSHNPDVAAAHIDPLLHYESAGWREGRDPSAHFSTSKYLAAYRDVASAGLDPLLHYIEYGIAEGRTAFMA